ncbi:MAG: hypothetical protein JSV92_01875 [archaeon]|nr:MAG: hypothetical protein JSV92_01875 [archaeon]
MEEKMKIKAVVGALVSVFIVLGFVLFRTLSITTESVLIYPLIYFKNFVSISASTGASEAILSSITGPMFFFIPLIPITFAFCVLIYYGINFGEDRKFGALACLIPSVIGLIIAGPSITFVLFSVGLVISGFLVTPMSVMYLEELKKWRKYRIGAKTISKCFFLLNLMIFFGFLISVFFGLGYYNELYVNETKSVVISLIPEIGGGEMPQMEGFELLPEEQQQEIEEEYSKLTEAQKEEVKNRIEGMFETSSIPILINFSIFFMPVMVFALLELFRVIILVPLAGLVTKLTLSQVKN